MAKQPISASLGRFIVENHPVRAIDCYVNSLDLSALGFANTQVSFTAGQPACAPGTLLKLYIYGYLNRVRSSRRLEHESYRNVEVMWLLEGLKPSYKTIADFRKVNGQALKAASRDFVVLCKELDLFGGELVAIDGSFFRANASKASIATEKKPSKALDALDSQIQRYLAELDERDEVDVEHISQSATGDKDWAKKLALITQRQQQLKALEEKKARRQAELKRLQGTIKQLSKTDANARLLSKNGQRTAGYNVQTGVDEKHALIVHYEVTNDGNDNQQLLPIARASKEILGVEKLTVLADSGYYNTAQIKASTEENITPYVAIPDKSKAIEAQKRYTRDAFTCDKENDVYHCPAGEILKPIGGRHEKRGWLTQRYHCRESVCASRALKENSLPVKTPYRQIMRDEYEEAAQAHKIRMANSQEKMAKRASLVEHPFGTPRRWCGWDHLLVRGFRKVRGEMGLLVLCYHLKRVLNIVGMERFKNYCAQRATTNHVMMGMQRLRYCF
jgi:transposase